MSDKLSRRSVLMGAGGLLMASAQGALPELKDGVNPGTVDFGSPEANLSGFIRMMASLEEVDVPWWYNGTVYSVIGEEQNPTPLFNFEGMELYLVTHLDDGTGVNGELASLADFNFEFNAYGDRYSLVS